MTSKRFSSTVVLMLAALAVASTASAQTGQSQAEADALALFRAKQAANQAAAEANTAAAKAGQAAGLRDAKDDAVKDQLKMVQDAVRNWKQPRGYSFSAASVNPSALQDPFAPVAPAAASAAASVVAALGTSGLVWDGERRIARVGSSAQQLCDGRLTAGDYPTLPDGALLDTGARITQFLATCANRSTPLMVVVASGDIEVRK